MSSDHIWPILFFVSLAGNLILLFYRPLLRLLRRGEEVSEDEIMAMVEEGEESGAIQSNEKELIENVFEFDTMTARDVMVHRTDMVTLSLDDDEETILSAIRESGLSRFPVYGSDLNDILGILNARDLLLDMASSRHRTVRELMRPAYLVPETLSADDLFRDMQHKKVHLAVVIDEYGELAGVVSLEDLLEEIVGNIYDEFDPAEPPELEHLEDGVWRCSGGLSVDTLAEELGFDPPEDADYDTVGGMVLSCLRTIPEDGSRPHVEAGGLDLQVEQVADHRIQWVLVRRSQPAAPHPQ